MAGIEKNFLNMQSMYGSEWVMRLYYNIQGNQELLDHICSLACFKSNIELCDLAEKNENFDLIYRFYNNDIWQIVEVQKVKSFFSLEHLQA